MRPFARCPLCAPEGVLALAEAPSHPETKQAEAPTYAIPLSPKANGAIPSEIE